LAIRTRLAIRIHLARWINVAQAITAARTSAMTTEVFIFRAFTTVKTGTEFFFAICVFFLNII
jgi:hypothetical protein